MVEKIVQENASRENLKTYEQQVWWEMVRENEEGRIVEREVETAGDMVIVLATDQDYANDLGTDHINPSMREEDWEKNEEWIIDGENSWLREIEFVVVKTRIYEDYKDWENRKIVKEGFKLEEDAEKWMEENLGECDRAGKEYKVIRRPNRQQKWLDEEVKKKCHICNKDDFKSVQGVKTHQTRLHKDNYVYEGDINED